MTRIVYVAPHVHEWGTETYLAADAEKIPGVTVDRVPEPRSAGTGWFVDLFERCEGADLLLYTKGYGLDPTLAVSAWRMIEAAGTQTASFHLDLYWGLARESEIGGDPMWRMQHVFTADGDPESARKFADRGINHHWLPPAVSSDACVPGERLSGVPLVAFVGGGVGYHPEHAWRQTLLQGLARRYGSDFKLWGQNGRVHGPDLNNLYRSATVVVGDSLCLPGHTHYTSDRLPETIGRGGFLIHPWIDGIADYYGLEQGKHCMFYNDGIEDLCERIDFWLDRPDKARACAEVGQAQIRAHHTYVNRARELLTVVGLL